MSKRISNKSVKHLMRGMQEVSNEIAALRMDLEFISEGRRSERTQEHLELFDRALEQAELEIDEALAAAAHSRI